MEERRPATHIWPPAMSGTTGRSSIMARHHRRTPVMSMFLLVTAKRGVFFDCST